MEILHTNATYKHYAFTRNIMWILLVTNFAVTFQLSGVPWPLQVPLVPAWTGIDYQNLG